VRSVYVSNGDDCLTVKGGCENVLVADAFFRFGHGATIGSILNFGVRNVTFRNIVLNATTNALQIKAHSTSKPAWVKDILYEQVRFN